MTEETSGTEGRTRRQQEQADGFDAIGSRYDEVFPTRTARWRSWNSC